MQISRVFSTIDANAAGEPLRIITAGVPTLPGDTILERRQYMLDHHDDIRRVLLFEPRGHADMYGGFVTPPKATALNCPAQKLTQILRTGDHNVTRMCTGIIDELASLERGKG